MKHYPKNTTYIFNLVMDLYNDRKDKSADEIKDEYYKALFDTELQQNIVSYFWHTKALCYLINKVANNFNDDELKTFIYCMED